MAKTYYDKDTDKNIIKGKRIVVLGYGSQGHGQALNLKDSGMDVVVSVRPGGRGYKLAQKHGDKVIVLKVNVDTERQLAEQAGVRSIPDVRILHGGKQVDQFVGLIPYVKIEKLILQYESLLPPPRSMPTLHRASGNGSIDPVTKKYLPPGISRK